MGDKRLRPIRAARGETDRDPPSDRIATAGERQSPDFVIIGTQRGGTTSMYRYLCEHPAVGAALRKEIHFFDHYYGRGADWYLAHFPRRGEYPVVGEASPYYLVHPDAPGRARRMIPEARLIALLRDPVARAWSQYHQKRERGVEDLPFAEALAREDERLMLAPEPLGPAWRHHSYKARGEYAPQLARWLAVYPREQVLVLKSEEFFANPAGILTETQRFLGLEPKAPAQFRPYHLADYPAMDPDIEQGLRRHFAPHNARLRELVGRDFGWDE